MPEHPTDAHFSFTFVFKQALKDIDLWAKENLSPNRVALRSKTLNKAS